MLRLRTQAVPIDTFAEAYIRHDILTKNLFKKKVLKSVAAYKALAQQLDTTPYCARGFERLFRRHYLDWMQCLIKSGLQSAAQLPPEPRWLATLEARARVLPRLLQDTGGRARAAERVRADDVVGALRAEARRRGELCSRDMYEHVRAALGLHVRNEDLHDAWVSMQSLSLRWVVASGRAGDARAASTSRLHAHVADVVLLCTDVDTTPLLTDESERACSEAGMLRALWALVRRHRLEEPAPPAARARRWTRAYRDYRDTCRLASVVVLQRRWHELKLRAARALREHRRRRAPPPAALLRAVLQAYPHVATAPAPSWRALVDRGDIITAPLSDSEYEDDAPLHCLSLDADDELSDRVKVNHEHSHASTFTGTSTSTSTSTAAGTSANTNSILRNLLSLPPIAPTEPPSPPATYTESVLQLTEPNNVTAEVFVESDSDDNTAQGTALNDSDVTDNNISIKVEEPALKSMGDRIVFTDDVIDTYDISDDSDDSGTDGDETDFDPELLMQVPRGRPAARRVAGSPRAPGAARARLGLQAAPGAQNNSSGNTVAHIDDEPLPTLPELLQTLAELPPLTDTNGGLASLRSADGSYCCEARARAACDPLAPLPHEPLPTHSHRAPAPAGRCACCRGPCPGAARARLRAELRAHRRRVTAMLPVTGPPRKKVGVIRRRNKQKSKEPVTSVPIAVQATSTDGHDEWLRQKNINKLFFTAPGTNKVTTKTSNPNSQLMKKGLRKKGRGERKEDLPNKKGPADIAQESTVCASQLAPTLLEGTQNTCDVTTKETVSEVQPPLTKPIVTDISTLYTRLPSTGKTHRGARSGATSRGRRARLARSNATTQSPPPSPLPLLPLPTPPSPSQDRPYNILFCTVPVQQQPTFESLPLKFYTTLPQNQYVSLPTQPITEPAKIEAMNEELAATKPLIQEAERKAPIARIAPRPHNTPPWSTNLQRDPATTPRTDDNTAYSSSSMTASRKPRRPVKKSIARETLKLRRFIVQRRKPAPGKVPIQTGNVTESDDAGSVQTIQVKDAPLRPYNDTSLCAGALAQADVTLYSAANVTVPSNLPLHCHHKQHDNLFHSEPVLGAPARSEITVQGATITSKTPPHLPVQYNTNVNTNSDNNNNSQLTYLPNTILQQCELTAAAFKMSKLVYNTNDIVSEQRVDSVSDDSGKLLKSTGLLYVDIPAADNIHAQLPDFTDDEEEPSPTLDDQPKTVAEIIKALPPTILEQATVCDSNLIPTLIIGTYPKDRTNKLPSPSSVGTRGVHAPALTDPDGTATVKLNSVTHEDRAAILRRRSSFMPVASDLTDATTHSENKTKQLFHSKMISPPLEVRFVGEYSSRAMRRKSVSSVPNETEPHRHVNRVELTERDQHADELPRGQADLNVAVNSTPHIEVFGTYPTANNKDKPSEESNAPVAPELMEVAASLDFLSQVTTDGNFALCLDAAAAQSETPNLSWSEETADSSATLDASPKHKSPSGDGSPKDKNNDFPLPVRRVQRRISDGIRKCSIFMVPSSSPGRNNIINVPEYRNNPKLMSPVDLEPVKAFEDVTLDPVRHIPRTPTREVPKQDAPAPAKLTKRRVSNVQPATNVKDSPKLCSPVKLQEVPVIHEKVIAQVMEQATKAKPNLQDIVKKIDSPVSCKRQALKGYSQYSAPESTDTTPMLLKDKLYTEWAKEYISNVKRRQRRKSVASSACSVLPSLQSPAHTLTYAPAHSPPSTARLEQSRVISTQPSSIIRETRPSQVRITPWSGGIDSKGRRLLMRRNSIAVEATSARHDQSISNTLRKQVSAEFNNVSVIQTVPKENSQKIIKNGQKQNVDKINHKIIAPTINYPPAVIRAPSTEATRKEKLSPTIHPQPLVTERVTSEANRKEKLLSPTIHPQPLVVTERMTSEATRKEKLSPTIHPQPLVTERVTSEANRKEKLLSPTIHPQPLVVTERMTSEATRKEKLSPTIHPQPLVTERVTSEANRKEKLLSPTIHPQPLVVTERMTSEATRKEKLSPTIHPQPLVTERVTSEANRKEKLLSPTIHPQPLVVTERMTSEATRKEKLSPTIHPQPLVTERVTSEANRKEKLSTPKIHPRPLVIKRRSSQVHIAPWSRGRPRPQSVDLIEDCSAAASQGKEPQRARTKHALGMRIPFTLKRGIENTSDLKRRKSLYDIERYSRRSTRRKLASGVTSDCDDTSSVTSERSEDSYVARLPLNSMLCKYIAEQKVTRDRCHDETLPAQPALRRRAASLTKLLSERYKAQLRQLYSQLPIRLSKRNHNTRCDKADPSSQSSDDIGPHSLATARCNTNADSAQLTTHKHVKRRSQQRRRKLQNTSPSPTRKRARDSTYTKDNTPLMTLCERPADMTNETSVVPRRASSEESPMPALSDEECTYPPDITIERNTDSPTITTGTHKRSRHKKRKRKNISNMRHVTKPKKIKKNKYKFTSSDEIAASDIEVDEEVAGEMEEEMQEEIDEEVVKNEPKETNNNDLPALLSNETCAKPHCDVDVFHEEHNVHDNTHENHDAHDSRKDRDTFCIHEDHGAHFSHEGHNTDDIDEDHDTHDTHDAHDTEEDHYVHEDHEASDIHDAHDTHQDHDTHDKDNSDVCVEGFPAQVDRIPLPGEMPALGDIPLPPGAPRPGPAHYYCAASQAGLLPKKRRYVPLYGELTDHAPQSYVRRRSLSDRTGC